MEDGEPFCVGIVFSMGACRAGTEAFAESLGARLKQQYTVREMIEVTEGQYGADRFREFWEAEIK